MLTATRQTRRQAVAALLEGIEERRRRALVLKAHGVRAAGLRELKQELRELRSELAEAVAA
ncbi:MAG TPA: hypothetical protein VHD91_07355 [Gaiellaceae bacterium]|nr:hypothetical protein [Gaiellaceae bacterium]